MWDPRYQEVFITGKSEDEVKLLTFSMGLGAVLSTCRLLGGNINDYLSDEPWVIDVIKFVADQTIPGVKFNVRFNWWQDTCFTFMHINEKLETNGFWCYVCNYSQIIIEGVHTNSKTGRIDNTLLNEIVTALYANATPVNINGSDSSLGKFLTENGIPEFNSPVPINAPYDRPNRGLYESIADFIKQYHEKSVSDSIEIELMTSYITDDLIDEYNAAGLQIKSIDVGMLPNATRVTDKMLKETVLPTGYLYIDSKHTTTYDEIFLSNGTKLYIMPDGELTVNRLHIDYGAKLFILRNGKLIIGKPAMNAIDNRGNICVKSYGQIIPNPEFRPKISRYDMINNRIGIFEENNVEHFINIKLDSTP